MLQLGLVSKCQFMKVEGDANRSPNMLQEYCIMA